MPEILGSDFCIVMAKKTGLVKRGFNGLEPLNWQDLNEWAKATRTPLTGWEMEVVHALSAHYERFLSLAEDPNVAEPTRTIPKHLRNG